MRSHKCHLAPVQRNTTRWTSTFHMVKRYFREGDGEAVSFEEAVKEIGKVSKNFSTKQVQREFLELIPNDDTRDNLYEIYKKLKIVNDCTIYLQTADLNILDAKNAIDELMKELDEKKWTDVIKKFCTDDYVDGRNLDFITAARSILDNPLAITELNQEVLWKFKKEVNPSCAVDISPQKPTATFAQKMTKKKKEM
jgi:hypothetical protein